MSSACRSTPRRLIVGFLFILSGAVPAAAGAPESEAGPAKKDAQNTALEQDVSQGSLRLVQDDGSIVECPLRHTDVQVSISGFIARVDVTQQFQNPTDESIEAVYVFPLPHEAAVDDMTMVLGERRIVGVIKRRDEARRIYEQALMQGRTAALLEQERPNIFTQSVGNIARGQEVHVRISYVDVLKYDMGSYEFHFPMVVGPRFIPGAPIESPAATPEALEGKVSPPVANTTRVPDAARISPPVLRPEFRNGHDISLTVSLDAGVPIQNLAVANHQAEMNRDGDRRASLKLQPADSLPNKDFVVRYDVAGDKPQMAVLAHTGEYSGDAGRLGSGYFMLMIQPKEDERLQKSPPREMVFLVDVSGSMRGAKTDKTREAMQHMLGLCREQDTVQVITFSSQANKLFERPLAVNEASIRRALNFTAALAGSGGTHMLEGIKLAIDEPIDKDRIRIIVMLTDGFIGNEAEIIQHVGQNCGDQIRFWTIGIGQSPNMFLIDGVARQGGGMGKRLGLQDEAEVLSHEVMARIQRAQLANVHIDWGQLQVAETYPARIPDLWAGRPVILLGRYKGSGRHEIEVSGDVEGEAVRWPLAVELPASETGHDVLAKVWARRKIEELMQQAYYLDAPAVEEEVTAIALDYRLMSQYTSFVAVNEEDVDDLQPPARPPRRMLVPVPLPEGAEWEGFFGERDAAEGLSFGVNFSRGGVALSGLEPAARRSLGRAPAAGPRGQLGYQASPAPSRGKIVRYRADTGSYYQTLGKTPAPTNRGLSLAQQVRRETLLVEAEAAERPATLLKRRELEDHLFSLPGYTGAALRPQGEQAYKAAEAAMQSAKQLQADGDDAAARAALVRACFLDRASANFAYSGGQLAGEALAALHELHRRQVTEWTEQLPQLGNQLDIVIRDQPMAEALQQVAAAGRLSIRLLPGSSEDATSAASERVSYVDLRGATVAQALDWILWPAQLSWRLQPDGVVAGEDRQLSEMSAWVYDVRQIALPTAEELGDQNDRQQVLAAATKAADDFLAVVSATVQADDELSVVWFAPGQLLVFGEPQRHARVAELLGRLADRQPDAALEGAAGKLQVVTARRAAERKEFTTKLANARRHERVAEAHATFGWQLLAAAAGGQLDDQACTELTIAWRDPATREMLEGQQRALAMRSLWMVSEAARALPGEPRLLSLSETARETAQPFWASILEELEKNADDGHTYTALLYASLALRDDARLRGEALPLLRVGASDEPRRRAAGLLAESLLSDRDRLDGSALSQLVAEGLAGEDMVALAALACRRAGGETWQSFRAEMRDLLASQPLPGHVVVLIHRLSHDHLAVTR